MRKGTKQHKARKKWCRDSERNDCATTTEGTAAEKEKDVEGTHTGSIILQPMTQRGKRENASKTKTRPYKFKIHQGKERNSL